MSSIAHQIATEHRVIGASNGTGRVSVRCSCGPDWHEDYPGHIEAEVRARLAGQYTAKAAHARNTAAQFVWQQAARTARGGDD